MNALEVVLVGAGRIAVGNHGLAGATPLSHLAAIRDVGAQIAVLRALVEPNEDARERARADWPEVAAAECAPDMADLPDLKGAVAVICTPSSVRRNPVEAAIRGGALAVVVEKPLAQTADEARALHAAAKAAGVPLVVNYNRRFDARIADAMRRGCEDVRSAELRYARGLWNYASHMLDLLVSRCGPIETVQWIAGACPDAAADANPSFALTFRSGIPVAALGHEGLDYDLLDLVLTTRAGRLRLLTGGAEIAVDAPQDDLHYKGYRHLATGPAERGAAAGFSGLYRALHDWLVGGLAFVGCDSAQAVHLAEAFEAISVSASRNGASIRLGD
ncbi:MAG: Gfo/Idh/MocA family oxidoreductase [Marivibrio sp.]|uniref:Gfo/Idh/MocA family oxidoreductase n=1 Tax=Marivibrio sp. TaxID=2039719 RepID=UPI0032EEEC0C